MQGPAAAALHLRQAQRCHVQALALGERQVCCANSAAVLSERCVAAGGI